jgi:UDP-glucose 4-epimerase
VKVLITGGAGFIGSTVASACVDTAIVPVIIDDLSSGRAEYLTGRISYVGDIADAKLVGRVFDEHPDISAVVHCAARIVVPESVEAPLAYYENNVAGTLRLLQQVLDRGCSRFLFSSSASIYGPGEDFSVDEGSRLEPSSPYAWTKAMVEQILADISEATDLRVLSLRYFNPIGADPLLRTGLQLPTPTHALGVLIRAHAEAQPFTLTGTNWPTRDGSAIRDYIHVWDLARAHVAALDRFDEALRGRRHLAVNLGTGRGTTVRELISAFEDVVGEPLVVHEGPMRPGDVVGAYTRSTRAAEVLGWHAERSVADGIRDARAWAARRPEVLGEFASP